MTRRRRLAALVGALAAALVLAGCSTVSSLINTDRALSAAGYSSVHVGLSQPDSLDVAVTESSAPSGADVRQVAAIVWQSFHERFDHLQVTVHGNGPSAGADYSFDQMTSMFGPRNPAWNRTSVSSGTTRLGIGVIAGVLALGVIVVVIVVLAVRRSRRRPPPFPLPYGPPGLPGPGGWGVPPGGWGYPPGAGPPPPPGWTPPAGAFPPQPPEPPEPPAYPPPPPPQPPRPPGEQPAAGGEPPQARPGRDDDASPTG